MAIGTKELLKRVKQDRLVENLSDRELNNPEGTGFDLRVKKIYKIKERGFLGVEQRKTPKVKLLAEHSEHKSYVLKPGEHILVETIEKVNMPGNLVAIFRPRSTLFRCGAAIHTAVCSPGYKGSLTFAMHNMSDQDFELELGSRIVQILFFPVQGDLHRTYEGQWQGGRVTTAGEIEKQI
ncbi:MAG: Deoxyuridine 5'-triphosphate nucleotidohydrolase [Candidatus Woesearchaeota archaeon]|nr:Deoxyuridine 5'-triphosphate nucleotidohydrolase [Candidatus Woesearchaeota archaeon]